MKNLIIPFLLFIIAGMNIHAQDSTTNLPLDEKVKIGKLPNGLTYYIRKNAEPKERAELNLVIKAGSLQENENQKGLAHFTEHMAFNGTRSFPKNELIDYLQKSGIRFGADLNAYTGFSETVYQLPIPTDDPELFESGFKILSEWAGAITFEAEEIDNERGVIVEEERQRGKNVSERLQKQLMPVLLANSRYVHRLPIGETEILENFEHQTLKDFYNDFYRPGIQAVIAVGDFDVEKVEKLIIKNFSNLQPVPNAPKIEEYEIPVNHEPLVKIATDPEFPYTVASVIYKHPETITRTREDLRNSIIRSAASSMIATRVQELIKNGNAPFLNAGIGYGPYQGGMVHKDAFSIQVVAKKPEELREAIYGIMDEVNKMLRFGFTATELDRVKTNFMSSIEKSFKEKDKVPSSAYLKQYIKHFTSGEAFMNMEDTYEFYKNMLPAISLEEVNKMAAGFITDKNQIIFIQAPEDKKEVLPDENTLINWVNNQDRTVSKYVDDVVDAPLIKETLEGGKVISSKSYPSFQTTEVVLSNGVKIILKPTDFKNDEIVFTAFSQGGVSLTDVENITSAKMADDIIGSSGVGNFSSNQLGKMLTGKSLSVGPYISTYSEGIQGRAVTRDIETALELTYLYFLHPRKDSASFTRLIENNRVAIEGKSANPMSVFQDTINTVMNGYGPWAASTTIEDLEKVSLDTSYEFYQSRFADASDFTFVFVGNFEVDQMLPKLEKYLGSLPSKGKKESFRDVGLKPVTGKVTKKVYRGLEDKAVSVFVFHNSYEFNAHNNMILQLVESALETRLLVNLREEAGGTYSPSVNVSYTRIPNPYYTLSVSYTCAVENVEKLKEITHRTIRDLSLNGPDASEIEKYTSQAIRQFETKIRTNNYWLAYLKNTYSNNLSLDRIDEYVDNLKALDPENVSDKVRELLSTENIMELNLLPEN